MRGPLLAGTPVLLLLLTGAGAATGAEEAVPLVLRLTDQAHAIWSALPSHAADARVTRLGDAPAECVTSALAEARRLLGQEPSARAALRDASLDLLVPRTVAERLARGDRSPSLLAPYVAASTRGDQVAQPLGALSCGAYYELRGAEGAPGGLVLALQVAAGCGCTQRGLRLHLSAQAPLTPGVMERKGVLRLHAGEARYEVMASCEPCDTPSPAAAPRAPVPGGDPCGSLCAPLAQGLAAWQGKLSDAAARLEGLASKATTLELQVEVDRRELAGAESARSKPRAVIETISALQARIKAAQAELARVRQASEETARVVSALRQVAGDAESAEGRCRAQCQARPPGRASTATGAGDAGGDGIGTGVLLAGGAAAAAGGAVALAGRGGSDAAGAPVDVSGLWRGTKVVISDVGSASPCRRVFDEDWQISQNGSSLEIAVGTIVTDCGPPACQGGCTTGPPAFPRRHLGTVSGSTAFVYPYPDYQIPACALPMSVQGSTLRGFMPACRTEQPLPVSMDVVLQRVMP